MTHYYARSGDFSNRFAVAAFDSLAECERWMERENRRESNRVERITRKDARRMLGANYLSPSTDDFRASRGCYLGSTNAVDDEYRERSAREESGYCWMETGADGEPITHEVCFANPPVRL